MNTKVIYAIIGVAVLVAGGYYLIPTKSTETPVVTEDPGRSAVVPGNYVIVSEESRVLWSAEKPKISGYVHHGSIGISEGSITASETAASGSFTLDMNTLRVTSLGGGKEGKESALEAHLKSKDFFDTGTYPTALFTIGEVMVDESAESDFAYLVRGTLSMKGITEPVEFPATIYQAADGSLKASASVHIDRTKWGITFGSGSFFDNLADNAISDFVTLSVDITAR